VSDSSPIQAAIFTVTAALFAIAVGNICRNIALERIARALEALKEDEEDDGE